MNFGINRIHIIQKYNNFFMNLNDLNNRKFAEDMKNLDFSDIYKKQKENNDNNKNLTNEYMIVNKVNSGTAKWIDVRW